MLKNIEITDKRTYADTPAYLNSSKLHEYGSKHRNYY